MARNFWSPYWRSRSATPSVEVNELVHRLVEGYDKLEAAVAKKLDVASLLDVSRPLSPRLSRSVSAPGTPGIVRFRGPTPSQ